MTHSKKVSFYRKSCSFENLGRSLLKVKSSFENDHVNHVSTLNSVV